MKTDFFSDKNWFCFYLPKFSKILTFNYNHQMNETTKILDLTFYLNFTKLNLMLKYIFSIWIIFYAKHNGRIIYGVVIKITCLFKP